MQQYETEQERFWAGEFGDAYVDRNRRPVQLAAKTALLAKILSQAGAVGSVLELGANVGLNLVALRGCFRARSSPQSRSITKRRRNCAALAG